LRIFAGIETIDRFNQADNSRVHQVLKRDLPGKPVMDTLSDIADVWQMSRKQTLALRRIDQHLRFLAAEIRIHGLSYPL
jgi:hypothetical protein